MYTGTLIDDLMATVERAEERAYTQANTRQERASNRYTSVSSVLEMGQRDPHLVGAA
jgi:hypothetical protein